MTPLSLSTLLRRYLALRMLLPGVLLVLVVAALLGWHRWLEVQRAQNQQALLVSEYVAIYLRFSSEVVNMLVAVDPELGFSQVTASYREHSQAFERIILLSDHGAVLQAYPPVGTLLDYSRLLPDRQTESHRASKISSPYMAPLSNNLTVSLFSHRLDGRLVVGELNLLTLQNFIAGLGYDTQGKLVFITDRFGNVLAHPDRTVVDQQANLGDLVPVSRALRGATGFLGVHAMQDSRYLFSASPVRGGEWFVFTAWNAQKQFFGVLVMLALFVITLHVLLLIAVRLLRRKLELEVSGPLQLFAQAMDRLEHGEERNGKKSLPLSAPFRELDLLQSRFLDMTTAIEQRERELRQSEERFRDLAGALPESVFEMNLYCVLTYVNQKILSRFGYTRKDVSSGLNLMDLAVVKERKMLFKHAEKVVRDEQMGPLEFTALTKDGRTFPAQLHCAAILVQGLPYGVRGFIIDMTHTIEEQGQRLAMERQMLHTQKLESLGVLAGGIAHDFNNLLAAIQGNLDLALMTVPKDSTGYARIRQADSAVRRASELTRQMLAYSGKGRLQVQHVDLSEFVRENLAMLQAVISKTVTLDLRLEEGLPLISADFGQLQQVVMNLITNASEAMNTQPGTMTVSTLARECDALFLSRSRILEKPDPGRYVMLEVRDTGTGIDERTMERLFDPFYTTKFTGRGLGLAAVQGIVQGHGGAIIVESEPGRGTLFQVLFPVTRDIVATFEHSSAEEELPEAFQVSDQPQGMVLVVDDEVMVRELCVEALEFLGYQSMTAVDGEDGVRVFREYQEHISCVILDLTMPKMNGVAALQAMRSIRPDVKIILCSGYNEQEATRNFLNDAPTAFLKKPFAVKELSTLLKRMMGKD
ncbi:MAG: response regulator [Desulfovibrionales bacterium]|nr:MAG: response regulator [Desulfovibrionales bacterium]